MRRGLVRRRGVVDATVETHWSMRAAHRRGLWVFYGAGTVVAREVGVGHNTRDGTNRAAAARRHGMRDQENDERGGRDARAPQAAPLEALDLRLAPCLKLTFAPAPLVFLAARCSLRCAGRQRLLRLLRLSPVLCRGATLTTHVRSFSLLQDIHHHGCAACSERSIPTVSVHYVSVHSPAE